MNHFVTIFLKTTWIVIYVLVFAASGWWILPKLNEMNGLAQRRDELRQEIDHEDHGVKELKNMQRRFKDDPIFLKGVAYANRRVGKDELVFIFDDPEPPADEK
ncbi:MAG: hypothetical protein LBW77_06270 [Verrucomicrobiota bacterium]|nr:hypothetical protein [Verrucomicrobiota bacterium]